MLSTGGDRQKSLLKVLALVSAALVFAATASAANPEAFGPPPSSTSVESLCGQAKGYLQNCLDIGKTEKERGVYLAIETALEARRQGIRWRPEACRDDRGRNSENDRGRGGGRCRQGPGCGGEGCREAWGPAGQKGSCKKKLLSGSRRARPPGRFSCRATGA